VDDGSSMHRVCEFSFAALQVSRIDPTTDPVANVIPRVIDVKMWYFF